MRNYSSIQVSTSTKSRLKGLAITKSESFENIILRLLDVKLAGREIDYLIKDKNSKNTCKAKVDWSRSKENIHYYDDEGDLRIEIPYKPDETWKKFRENILELTNLINLLAVLEENEEIDAGEIILQRLT